MGHVTVRRRDNFTRAQYAHFPFYGRYVRFLPNGLIRVVSYVPVVVIRNIVYVYLSTCLDLHTCLGFLYSVSINH
jgi:hypothetical protein